MLAGTTVRSPQGTIEASVLIAGQPVPVYRRTTDGALFVAGFPGAAYTLRVRNLTSGRIEILNAVDGRNTLKDEPADMRASTGMVFGPHQQGDFTGWRMSDDEASDFLFGAPERSIAAAATGSTANVGVIGFAAYREQQRHDYLRSAGAPVAFASGGPAQVSYGGAKGMSMGASAAADEPVSRGLGTGMGERHHDHVGRTSFERAAGDPDVLAIGYDTSEALDAMGITGPAEPNPFPGAGTGYEKYAQAGY